MNFMKLITADHPEYFNRAESAFQNSDVEISGQKKSPSAALNAEGDST
jgi:hypothetical protein